MSKIVLLDVDGTLVDYSGKLPESARDAVREARKNGHRVYIVTGRSRAEVYDFIWEIGLDGMIFGEDLLRDDVNKISYVLGNYQDHLECKERFQEFQNGTWGGVGKREDTIAFGDAQIDIPMFEYCNYSVCMGNGGEQAKEVADEIAGDVDDDGLYHAFKKLGLIK